jgi:hypothetical protein
MSELLGYCWFIFYAIYYIDFTLLLAVIKHWKKELVFHCRMLNEFFYCDDYQWNHSEIKHFYFTVWNTSFYFTFIITLFLLLSLGGYLCWWTISPWGYHSLSSLGFYHWVDTSVGGLLVPEGIVHSVVWASPLTWFIRYIYYWNLLFLNNMIINETKVVFPQT